MKLAHALSIAGSDSGGGAGIQADLKTWSALGVFGMTAITAVTAQNTLGVQQFTTLAPELVRAQIDSVFSDIRVDVVKIGMLGNAAIIDTVAAALRHWKPPCVVLDPVMVAKGGDALLAPDAVATLIRELLPLADILTPNLPETEAILEHAVASLDEMRRAAQEILAIGVRAVVVKGGHLADTATDILATRDRIVELPGERVPSRHTHGTGCTFSAALAAFVARGLPLEDAVRRAKEYVTGAIRAGINLGHGIGPTNHFFAMWKDLK